MNTDRLETFSDGFIAIIITIMVLELRIPHGADLHALRAVSSAFAAYVISFVFLSIYWNNHHHMLNVTEHVNGAVMWANLHLLFWLSLVPATTSWLGANPSDSLPAAVYGVVFFCAAMAYAILQNAIIRLEGPDSVLAKAIGKGWKEKVSPLLYLSAIGLAFVHPWLADALYAVVALIWLVPDRRISKEVESG